MTGVIKNVRGGSVKWNEEDRLQLATLLVKAGDTRNRKEYVVVFEE